MKTGYNALLAYFSRQNDSNMKETTPAAMPPCFEKWCQRFDDVFTHKAQKREFRHYLGGLLGESERKNLFQLAENALRGELSSFTPLFNRSTGV